jgi:hypothetical protein
VRGPPPGFSDKKNSIRGKEKPHSFHESTRALSPEDDDEEPVWKNKSSDDASWRRQPHEPFEPKRTQQSLKKSVSTVGLSSLSGS